GYFGLCIGDVPRALLAYERARLLQEKLRAEHPEIADYTTDLGWSLLTLGELKLDRDGPTAEVLALLDRARKHFSDLNRTGNRDRSSERILARAQLLLSL